MTARGRSGTVNFMEHAVTSSTIALAPGGGETLPFLTGTATIKAPGIVEQVAPPGFGTPLHNHHAEDEWFYVLDGELTIWVGGETFVATPGAFAFGPRGVPHTFLVTGDGPARFLLVAQPAGFEEFVREAAGEVPPTPEQLTEIAAGYGIEILGPPGIPS